MAEQGKPPYAKLGGYELRRELGRGGMGVVYEAYDSVLDRTVALKILPRKFASDKTYATRFLNEARAAARLNHPNIVTIHAVGEAEGRQFIAMECVRGVALSAVVKTGHPMVVSSALQILGQAAEALGAAHGQGIIHRDIKPQNIMVDAANRVKVLDFGLAKLLESSTGLTSVGTALGTPRYMAPEQVQGKPADARSDIYSLGVVFYELLAGRPAFQGDSPMAVMYQIVHEPFPSLSDAQLKVPAGVERILQKMVARDPNDRYASAGDVAREIAAVREESRPEPAVAAQAVAERHVPRVYVDDDLRSEIVNQVAAKTPPPRPPRRFRARLPSKFTLPRRGIAYAALTAGAVVVAAVVVPPLARLSAGGWERLLADPTLANWHNPNPDMAGDLAEWHMEGEALTNAWEGAPPKSYTLARYDIATRKEWRDFELQLEYKLSPGANSGVYLRGCVEIQLWDSGLAATIPTGRHGAVFKQFGPLADAAKRAGEWNRLEVTYVGDQLTARLNGTLIHDEVQVTRPTSRNPMPGDPALGGPLLLQNYGNPVWFRRIRIRALDKVQKELPPVPLERVVQFPSGESLGDLYARNWGDIRGDYERLGNYAQGPVQVPAGKELALDVRPSVPLDFSFVNHLGGTSLQGLSARSSRLRDLGWKATDWQAYFPTVGRVAISNLDALARLKYLTAIQCGDYDLPSDTFEVLSRLPNLAGIQVNFTSMEWIDFGAISELSSLRVLDLSRTDVNDVQLSFVGGLTALEELDLDFTPVSDEGVAHLAGLRSLRRLSLTRTKVTDASCSGAIKWMRELRVLGIPGTAITDEGLAHFAGLSQLEQLWLADTKVSEDGKAKFRQALPNCRLVYE